MNKAEETLNIKQNISEYYFTKTGEKYISEVMKQHAIEFVEWAAKSFWQYNPVANAWQNSQIKYGYLMQSTTEQLYNEFNEQKP